eukprot:TRINITY_DN4411_c0_g1_i2.p3 TRINITY_DN4411_c0_g1~~TRINITY_DN4411_c0_g1_i2.p3  ORF type:complete len:123 (+),score=40.28 TRINITY_DN4411_c0_g1_i2:82-450(+)
MCIRDSITKLLNHVMPCYNTPTDITELITHIFSQEFAVILNRILKNIRHLAMNTCHLIKAISTHYNPTHVNYGEIGKCVGVYFYIILLSDSQSLLNPNYQTCLLYTSPSPRDLSTSRMPSSA